MCSAHPARPSELRFSELGFLCLGIVGVGGCLVGAPLFGVLLLAGWLMVGGLLVICCLLSVVLAGRLLLCSKANGHDIQYPPAQQTADTKATQTLHGLMCRSCVRCLVCCCWLVDG